MIIIRVVSLVLLWRIFGYGSICRYAKDFHCPIVVYCTLFNVYGTLALFYRWFDCISKPAFASDPSKDDLMFAGRTVESI